jgi:hypothetical protein
MSFYRIKHNEKGNYVCCVKNCRFKKRNGRCSERLITFLVDKRAKCVSYRPRLDVRTEPWNKED